MRRPLWVLLAVLLAIPALSLAQYESEEYSKIEIKGGVHRPSGSAVRDEASMWPEIGIDYVLRFNEVRQPQDVISLTYTGASRNLMDAKLMGMEYMRYWSKSTIPDRGVYYGAGAGLFITKAKLDETFLRPAVDESGIKPGLSVMGGYHLSEFWFAEVRYTLMGNLAEDVNLGGLSVFVGAKRFL